MNLLLSIWFMILAAWAWPYGAWYITVGCTAFAVADWRSHWRRRA